MKELRKKEPTVRFHRFVRFSFTASFAEVDMKGQIVEAGKKLLQEGGHKLKSK